MKLSVTSVDYAPLELHSQTPFEVKLLRELPGPDRTDYWIGELSLPLRWMHENHEREISHLIVTARWIGMRIEPNVTNIPIGIAFVTDMSQMDDPSVDFNKCRYIAIGIANETAGGVKPEPLGTILQGNIARAFGMGGSHSKHDQDRH